MDKNLTNLLVATLRVNVPKSLLIKEGVSFEANMIEGFHFPLIVKPNTGGSSIATTKTQDHSETMEAVGKIQSDDTLLQECIE
jgi:D-alanine-D-alanine ligase